MKFLRTVRASLGMTAVFLFILVMDPVHRILFRPVLRVRPGSEPTRLTGWTEFISGTILGILRLAGVSIELPEPISGDSDTLILMSHQSLIDIPIAFQVVRGRYPRIVTRDRYGRGIPMVSVLLNDLGCPLVSPGSGNRGQLQALTDFAKTTENPVLIYPEGTRSRTGKLGHFKRAGLENILAARPWNVWVVAVDGLWRAGKVSDFPGALVGIRGRVGRAGPFRSPEPGEEIPPFIGRMEEQMSLLLNEMRAEAAE